MGYKGFIGGATDRICCVVRGEEWRQRVIADRMESARTQDDSQNLVLYATTQFAGTQLWASPVTRLARYRPFYPALAKRFHKKKNGDDIVLVDVGCSRGIATYGMKRFLEVRGYTVASVGVDARMAALQEALERGFIDEAKFGFAQRLPLADDIAGIVVCCNVLDRLQPEQQAMGLKEIVRAMKPNGIFLGTVHAVEPYASKVGVYLSRDEIRVLTSKSRGFSEIHTGHVRENRVDGLD